MNFEKTTPRVRGWLDNAHTVLKAAVLPYWNADPAALRDPISDANPKIDFIFKFNNKDRSVDSTFVTAKGTSRQNLLERCSLPSIRLVGGAKSRTGLCVGKRPSKVASQR